MKIIVGIATHKGREETLKRTIDSLLPYVDDIHVYDNEKNEYNATDNGKFHFLHLYNKPIYAVTADDDLIYPPDYIDTLLNGVEKHGTICTFHGRKLQGLNRSYYKGHKAYACLKNYPQTTEIDVAGTGVSGWRTDLFNPVDLWKHEDKLMSDIIFSLEAAKQGVGITHLGHKGDWIIQQPIPIEKTIYGRQVKKEHRQIELANEIYRIKYRTY
jgi:hypothetical protein